MHETVDEHMLEHILAANEDLAAHNREHFDEQGLWSVNLMSAPGAGKTTLLQSTLESMKGQYSSCVIEGDMVGELDAERLRKIGIEVFQIATGRSCHLDAKMISRLLHVEKLKARDCLFIENVGNLVCPAEFPLGEHKRVVLLSVTEGDDKPLKYPVIFNQCHAVVFTKCDLLPHVNFNLERAAAAVKDLNPLAKTFAVSTVSGQGMRQWLDWLEEQIGQYRLSGKGETQLVNSPSVGV